MSRPPATRGVHHLAILVRDLPASEAFYGQVLGLAVLRRLPVAAGNEPGQPGPDRSVWLDTGDGAFLALERAPPRADAPEEAHDDGGRAGLHLIALRIERAARAAWEERLTGAGVAIYHRTPYTLYVRDPEGNRVGLSHWPDPE